LIGECFFLRDVSVAEDLSILLAAGAGAKEKLDGKRLEPFAKNRMLARLLTRRSPEKDAWENLKSETIRVRPGELGGRRRVGRPMSMKRKGAGRKKTE